MLRRMEVKGSDYLRPFARTQEIIAAVAVPKLRVRSKAMWRGHNEVMER